MDDIYKENWTKKFISEYLFIQILVNYEADTIMLDKACNCGVEPTMPSHKLPAPIKVICANIYKLK